MRALCSSGRTITPLTWTTPRSFRVQRPFDATQQGMLRGAAAIMMRSDRLITKAHWKPHGHAGGHARPCRTASSVATIYA